MIVPLRRVAADAPPGDEIICEDDEEPERRDHDARIVDHARRQPAVARRGDDALLPGKRNGQIFVGPSGRVVMNTVLPRLSRLTA